MSEVSGLLVGEFYRNVDERFRISIPSQLTDVLAAEAGRCVLTKERRGCLGLWAEKQFHERMEARVRLLVAKLQAGRLSGRVSDVQRLGRLLSTRHRELQLDGRGRLVLPEGFREFLGVEPGGDVLTVGAAVCVEIWSPTQWIDWVSAEIGQFDTLLEDLTQ